MPAPYRTNAIPPPVTSSLWVGGEISRIEVMLVMGIALQMALTSALQPLLLKALVLDDRLTTKEVGAVAACELIAAGLVVTFAMVRFRPTRLRQVVALASACFCVANLATAYAPGPFILALRLITGSCCGIFLWLIAGLMSRSTLPARINGMFLAVQGTAGLLSAALLENVVVPRFGAAGAFWFMACIGATAATACPWLPRRYAPIPGQSGTHAVRPTRPGLVALATIFVTMAGIVAAWVLLPLLSRQFGYPPSVTSIGMPLSLAMQVVGGLCAAGCAARFTYRQILPAATVAFALLLIVLLTEPGPAIALMGYAVFGFLWMLLAPFGYSYTMAADPSRSSVMFMSPAQLLGAGAGPMIASFGVSGNDVRGGVVVAIMLLIGAISVFFLSVRRHGR